MKRIEKIVLGIFLFTILTPIAFGKWVEVGKTYEMVTDRESIATKLSTKNFSWVRQQEVARMIAGYKVRRVNINILSKINGFSCFHF